MTWVNAAIAGGAALVGAGAQIYSSNKAADAMQQSANQANAMSERIYAQQRTDQIPYMQSGYNALNAYNRAMGLPTVDASISQASMGAQSALGGLRMIPVLHGKKAVFVDDQGNGYTQAVAGNNRGQWIPVGQKYPEYALPQQQATQQAQQPAQQQTGDDRYGGFYASPGYQFRLDEGTRALDRSAAARGLLLSGAQNKALTRYGQGVASEEFGNYTNRLAAIAGLGQTANQSVASSAGMFGANAGNAIMQGGMARASGYLGTGNAINSFANNFASALPFLQANRGGTVAGPNMVIRG